MKIVPGVVALGAVRVIWRWPLKATARNKARPSCVSSFVWRLRNFHRVIKEVIGNKERTLQVRHAALEGGGIEHAGLESKSLCATACVVQKCTVCFISVCWQSKAFARESACPFDFRELQAEYILTGKGVATSHGCNLATQKRCRST
jgi:hypothetical protein